MRCAMVTCLRQLKTDATGWLQGLLLLHLSRTATANSRYTVVVALCAGGFLKAPEPVCTEAQAAPHGRQ